MPDMLCQEFYFQTVKEFNPHLSLTRIGVSQILLLFWFPNLLSACTTIGVKVGARSRQVTCRLRVETRLVCHPNFSIKSRLIEILNPWISCGDKKLLQISLQKKKKTMGKYLYDIIIPMPFKYLHTANLFLSETKFWSNDNLYFLFSKLSFDIWVACGVQQYFESPHWAGGYLVLKGRNLVWLKID